MLGQAIRLRRAGRPQVAAEGESTIPRATLSRIERGTHAPSADTARALARWLGWTVEQVFEAAETPVAGDAAGEAG